MTVKKRKLRSILFMICACFVITTIFLLKPCEELGARGKKVTRHNNEKPNIIILLLDCVRADHLSCYGYTRNTSPQIDALATQGIKINYAISQASWTFPSVFSLLSGSYPHKHGAWYGTGLDKKQGDPLRKKLMLPSKTISLLPEQLQKAGYFTCGFSTNSYINDERMRERGFDEFKLLLKAPAMAVVNYALEKIRLFEKTGDSFFLYLHFMDSHHPLQPPEKYYNFFPASDGEKNRSIHEEYKYEQHQDQYGKKFDNYREHKISLYDGTIRYADAEIGRLITGLKNSKLTNNTLVVLLADHGEEFWDHAVFEAIHYPSCQKHQGTNHGHTLFQELIRVPLIITNFYPKGTFRFRKWKPKEIQDIVQLVDLLPTLMDMIDLQPVADCDGISLLPLIEGSRIPFFNDNARFKHRSIFSQTTASGIKTSLIEYPYKFIHAHKETNALFNLEKDCEESINLTHEKQERTSDMLKKVLHFKEFKPPETEEIHLSEDDLEKLKALGYIDKSSDVSISENSQK